MNCRFILLLCLFLTAAVFRTGAQESILWKINMPGVATSSYIICTSEVSGIENYDINAIASGVMKDVNTVGFFCIPDASDKQNIPTIMSDPGDRTLKGYYKREDRIRFELMVRDKLNTDIEALYTLKPIYLQQLFKEQDHKNGAGFQQKSLFGLAIENTKPTLSLITLHQLASAMDGVDFDTQAFILAQYMLNVNAYIDAENQKLNYYKNQQLSELAKKFYETEQSAYIETYINALTDLLQRKIETLSELQSALYVIDAELALGEAGLITKLRSKGFTVTPVPVSLNQRDLNNTTESTATNNASDDVPPDHFPALATSSNTNEIIDPSDITIVQSDEIVASYSNRAYHAFSDPFNDMFDYASADTLFIEYWFEMKGTEADFKIKVPIKGDWEETVEDNVLGTIKRYVYQTNHARTDLYYSVGYTVYPPSFSIPDKNAFFNDFLDRAIKNINGKPIAQRIISTPTFTGREFTAVVGDSNFVRSMFFLKDNILFELLVGGPGDNAYSAYAEAFLRSFETTASSLSSWYLFEQPGFKCYLPTPPSRNTQSYNVGSGALNLVTYTAEDYKENITYSISVYNYPPGYNFKAKNAFYEELIANAERQYFGKAAAVEKVTKNGIQGRYVVMPLMNKKTLLIYFFFDKSAVYQYSALGDPGAIQSLNVKRFFDSFLFSGEGEGN